jgi:hypothetical protein
MGDAMVLEEATMQTMFRLRFLFLMAIGKMWAPGCGKTKLRIMD